MSVVQVNKSQNICESRSWQWVIYFFDKSLCVVLIPSCVLPPCYAGFVSLDKVGPKTRKLLPFLQLLNLSFPAPRSSGPSQWLLLPLVFFPLPVDTNSSQTVALVLTLVCTLVIPTLSSLGSCCFLYFSAHSGCLEAWLHLLPAILSAYLSWTDWEIKMCVAALCHSCCGFKEAAGFVKVLLLFFITLLMKQSGCAGNFQLTLNFQVLRNLHST